MAGIQDTSFLAALALRTKVDVYSLRATRFRSGWRYSSRCCVVCSLTLGTDPGSHLFDEGSAIFDLLRSSSSAVVATCPLLRRESNLKGDETIRIRNLKGSMFHIKLKRSISTNVVTTPCPRIFHELPTSLSLSLEEVSLKMCSEYLAIN